jgi:hypothetical protein
LSATSRYMEKRAKKAGTNSSYNLRVDLHVRQLENKKKMADCRSVDSHSLTKIRSAILSFGGSSFY